MSLRIGGRCLGRRPTSSLDEIFLAIDTTGRPVYVDWRSRHLLGVGESGTGKSTVLANLLVEIEPFVQFGLVRVYGIDLKALELAMSRGLLEQVATDVDSSLGWSAKYVLQ